MTPLAAPRKGSQQYCDPEKLRVLVEQYQATGTASNELGAMLLLIAGGVWDRFASARFTDRDDFIGAAVLHLLDRPLKAADPARNLFSFFTTCAVRFGAKERAKGDHRAVLWQEYGHMRALVREIPERE